MRRYTSITNALALFSAVLLLSVSLLYFAGRNFYRSAYPVKYADAVAVNSELYDLPKSLIYAVIRTESGFDPNARSSADAVGLMQITSDTFDWTLYRLNEKNRPFSDLLDHDTNIRYGSALLRLLMDEFGSLENTLCAYHAGWGRVKEWISDPLISTDGVNIGNIPFSGTRKYVEKVLKAKEMYENLYNM